MLIEERRQHILALIQKSGKTGNCFLELFAGWSSLLAKLLELHTELLNQLHQDLGGTLRKYPLQVLEYSLPLIDLVILHVST